MSERRGAITSSVTPYDVAKVVTEIAKEKDENPHKIFGKSDLFQLVGRTFAAKTSLEIDVLTKPKP